MFKIQTLNNISVVGLDRLPRGNYEIASEMSHPDAILVRSAKMHDMILPDSVKAIGRAGAGVNNIPVDAMTAAGIPVFNAPGANANAGTGGCGHADGGAQHRAGMAFRHRPVRRRCDDQQGS